MEIPSYLETQIREGKVVLFLGAGASREAQDGEGRKAPTGNELRDLLADKFLGGKHKDLPLDQVGEYCISESDLVSVQEYPGIYSTTLRAVPTDESPPNAALLSLGGLGHDKL
jgi:hypothetical protein